MISAAQTEFNSQNSGTPLVTFMIATHNRVSELVKTLESCRAQDWPAKEIIVVDDASTDGTSKIVRDKFPAAEFPELTLITRTQNQGSIAARNEIMRRAQGKYIIALDDDSRLVDQGATTRIVARLEREPDLGIVSLLVIGPEHPERDVAAARSEPDYHCSSFAACGAVIRRDMLEHTGLFPEYFYHAYEEPDLCLRAWDAGYRVLQWNDIVVYHEFSLLNRNEQRTHRRHARNEACSIWMRYPWPLVVPATLARLASQTRYALRRGWLRQEPRVWAEVVGRLPRAITNRKSVGVRAVKISLGVNRTRISDPKQVWALGDLPWKQVLRRAANERPTNERPTNERSANEHA